MSLFQSLPLDIVEQVVNYSLDNSAYKYKYKYSTHKQLALSLLHSCHNWRVAFAGAAFDTLELKPSQNNLLRIRFSKFCEWINPLSYPLDLYVKSLKITFVSWDCVMSGTVGTWMASSGFADMRLPRLHSFALGLNYGDRHRPSSQDNTESAQNIISFFQLLRKIMPHMRNIAFERNAFSLPVDDETIRLFAKSDVLDLLCSVNSVNFDYRNAFAYLKHTGTLACGNLTSLYYAYLPNADITSFLEIARRNSQTIVCLDMLGIPQVFFQKLIRFSNGKPIVYPRLQIFRAMGQRVELTMNPALEDGQTDSPLDTNHFPALKTLDLDCGHYPFEYNILAGGLNNTLEKLILADMCFKGPNHPIQTLSSSQFINLRIIKLARCEWSFSYALRDAAAQKQLMDNISTFFQSLLPHAVCLNKFNSEILLDKSLYIDDTSCLPFNNLRYLDTAFNIFEFSNIIQILKKAPYLRRLTCVLDDNIPKIEGVGPMRLPKYIHSLGPINSHFVELRVNLHSFKLLKRKVKTVVLLAIGCPNFYKVTFTPSGFYNIRDLISKLLKTAAYKNYADAGKRLIDVM